jgi:tyrosine-protein phosphatase YwqE
MNVIDLFQRKKNLISDSLLMGMIDIHSHLLPKVDDGVNDIKEALFLLSFFEKIGIKKMFLTPHIKGDFPKNNSAYIKECFNNFITNEQINIQIRLAAEYMLDEFFYNHLNANDLLTFDGKHVLIEMSYLSAPINLYEMIYDIMLNGYIPIVAHPERYTFLTKKEYDHLKTIGCKFQLNLFSLNGYYGKETMNRSKDLIEHQHYDFVGTDTHNKRIIHKFQEFSTTKKIAEQLSLLLENNKTLFVD